MRTFLICPISLNKINERVARGNATFTVLLLIIFGLTMNIIPVLILVLDFLFRATELPQYSLFTNISKALVRYLKLSKKQINAGPKILAARVGLLLSILILLGDLFDYFEFTMVILGMLGLFSFLEAAFGICVACEIYPFIYKMLYKSEFKEM